MGSLTYSTTSTTVPLSDDLAFPDQYTWAELQTQKTYSVTGALIVQTGQKQTGRSITLQGDERHGWVTRSQLATLRTLAATPGAVMTLEHRGATYSVMFDHDAGAIEATPVVDFATEEATDFFVVTLRFFEV